MTVDVLSRVSVLTPDGGPLRLRRAWPRGGDRLALEYRHPDGATVAAQWFADEARGRRVARGTQGAAWVDGVVLHPAGADRKLPGLADLVREPGATLLVHRPERRAVVHRGGTFTKVVRPDRVRTVTDSDRLARSTGVPMAELVGVDEARGTVDWRAAPGRALHDLLFDPEVTDAALVAAGRAVGETVRALHGAAVPDAVPDHGPDDELRAAERWLDAARWHGRPLGTAGRLLDQARRSFAASAVGPSCLLHRDLHDKQLLVDGADVVVLDVDTLAVGEPALDLANLLVHLQLRIAQGAPAGRADLVTDALLDAYAPDAAVRDRVPAYALATLARLAGVYAFRPHQTRAHRWLHRPGACGDPARWA